MNSSAFRVGRIAQRHQPIFSSGAYSSISFRSLWSFAKRTVTSPPASIRVTTPSPSEPWRTESPVWSDGISLGARVGADGCPVWRAEP